MPSLFVKLLTFWQPFLSLERLPSAADVDRANNKLSYVTVGKSTKNLYSKVRQ